MSIMQMLLATSAGGGGIDVDDVYSTDTWTGDAAFERTITTGLDVSGEGGMVWSKCRSNAGSHSVGDTERDVSEVLLPNKNFSETTSTAIYKQYTSTGFKCGNDTAINANGRTYVAWSFVKAAKFFDIVTYTGNGTAGRTVSHNLGAVPGMIWVKQTDGSSDWICYHKGLGNTAFIRLNTDAGAQTFSVWNNTTPTATEFTVGTLGAINGNGNEFIAYLFAEDTDNLIKCGDYNGNGGTQTINCGFQPQFVLIKSAASGSNDWVVLDSARSTNYLRPNTNGTETNHAGFAFASNGFTLSNSQGITNGSGKGYVYIAIAAS